MALTAKQRNALPRSAFAIPTRRAYPMPTKAQARKAGIGERQRLGLHRNALARASQSNTGGSYARMGKIARARTGGAVATVGRAKGNTSTPGLRGHSR
jgi:hypothetical protein